MNCNKAPLFSVNISAYPLKKHLMMSQDMKSHSPRVLEKGKKRKLDTAEKVVLYVGVYIVHT